MSSQSSSLRTANLALDKLQAILMAKPMSIVYMTSALAWLFAGKPFLAMVSMVMIVYSNPLMIWQLQSRYRNQLGKYRLNAALVTGIVFGLLAGLTLCLSWVDPSHAQFFTKAESFITAAVQSNLAGNSNTTALIKLVMNTLRVLFVMYMLFGVVQVFQAVRQGEEWKDLARTPFFVMLAGTMGDVLVGAITGA
jgi:hypothetical protein